MDNHETSSSPPTGKRRRGYRPAIVLFVVLAALVIGIVLKNTREPQTAINAPEPSTTTAIAMRINGPIENPE